GPGRRVLGHQRRPPRRSSELPSVAWPTPNSPAAWPRRATKCLDDAVGVLLRSCVSAAEQLGTLCTTADSENVQLTAARAILEQAAALRENLEIAARLTAIEQRLNDSTESPSPVTSSGE